MLREETKHKGNFADDTLLVPEGTVEGFRNWGRLGKEDRGKCKACPSNWKVESGRRSTKESGGLVDTHLQNKRRELPVILARRWTEGTNLPGIGCMSLAVTL